MQRAIVWAATAPPNLGPLAHWKLDDGIGTLAVDSEGGHDGTLTNNPTWVAGLLGDALDFDGSNDYISVPHDDGLSLTSFSISAWIYPNALSGWQVFVNKGTTTSAVNYYLSTNGDEIGLGFYNAGWVEFNSTSANLSTGEWFHVAATYEDSTRTGTIYLDGAPIFTDTVGKSPLPNNEALTIGRSGFGEYWSGTLDDVRIYDRSLSGAEMADLAAGGAGGGPGSSPTFESFEETIDADNDTAAISVNKPAGTATGELLIAVVVTNRNNESTLVADDAGWNLLTVDAQASSSTTGVWWRLAGASEPASYGFSWDAAAPARSYSWIMRFTGNDPTSPINVWDKFGECCSMSPLSPTVTTTVDDTLILRIGGFDDDDITIGDPGMAGHTPITMQKSNTGTGTVSGGAAYVVQTASGNSGTANFTLTNTEQSRTITIGIAPAP